MMNEEERLVKILQLSLWGEDSCTALDAEGKAIEDFMIDIENDGEICYTPVSNPSVTLNVA